MAQITFNLSTASIPLILDQFKELVGRSYLQKRLRRIQNKFPRGKYVSEALVARYAIPIGINKVYGPRISAPRGLVNHDQGLSYEAVSFAAAAVELSRHLSPRGRNGLRGRVLDALDPSGDARSLAHEFRVITSLAKWGWDIEFTDFEGRDQFDFIVRRKDQEVEIEAKTITGDCGNAVHVEDFEGLANQLKDAIFKGNYDHRFVRIDVALAARLPRNDAEKRQLVKAVIELLNGDATTIELSEASVAISPIEMPITELNLQDSVLKVVEKVREEQNGAVACVASKTEFIAIHVYSTRKPKVHESIFRVIKDGANQLSGSKPGIVWSHFADLPDIDLEKLIEIFREGGSTLLQEIAAKLFMDTHYTHLSALFFSGEAPPKQNDGLNSLLIYPTFYSQSGILYPLWNKNCTLNKPFKELI